jgi:ATP-binding cassette subfamily B (MDR/TAP) protein 1
MTLIFGNLVQSFVNFGTTLAKIKAGDPAAQAELPAAAASFRHVAAKDATILVYIGELSRTNLVASFLIAITGVAMFFCTFTYMYIFVYTGEIGAKRLRERYLQAVLRQDIAFFDNVGAGEVATRIQTDTREFGCNVYNLLDCIYICRSRPARHL